jgi:hypothetical protein
MMTKIYEEIDDLNIGLAAGTDEYLVLYESDDKTERIVLFRNMLTQIEYILLSPHLLDATERNRLMRNYLELNEYHLLLKHQYKIQLYQFKFNRLALFHAFFRMTTSAFFNSIAVYSN